MSTPAWKTKPSWYVIATNDRVIPANIQTKMSERMKAETISVGTSHVAMLAKPDAVAAHIIRATEGAKAGRVAQHDGPSAR